MITVTLMANLLSAGQIPGHNVITDLTREPVYTIPSGNGLEEPLDFTFDANLQREDDKAVLEVKLPALLIGGKGKLFKMNGTVVKDRILFEGSESNADCAIEGAQTRCNIDFGKLIIDRPSAEQAELDMGATQLSRKLQLAREAFSHQAVGTITFFAE